MSLNSIGRGREEYLAIRTLSQIRMGRIKSRNKYKGLMDKDNGSGED